MQKYPTPLSMNQILLAKSPPLQSYDSFKGAIRGPKEHRLNQAATESTAILAGAKVSEFQWSVGRCSIGFSSGLSLHIKARNSVLFYILAMLNTELRDMTIFREMFNKSGHSYTLTCRNIRR